MRVLQFISSARTCLAFGFLFGLALPVAPLLNGTASQSKPRYSAEIRRASHGVPHITAKDMGSLGFGEGYVANASRKIARQRRAVCDMAQDIPPGRGSYIRPAAALVSIPRQPAQ